MQLPTMQKIKTWLWVSFIIVLGTAAQSDDLTSFAFNLFCVITGGCQ